MHNQKSQSLPKLHTLPKLRNIIVDGYLYSYRIGRHYITVMFDQMVFTIRNKEFRNKDQVDTPLQIKPRDVSNYLRSIHQ